MKQWNETKAERKARKARERAGLSVIPASKPDIETTSNPKRYVACLKWGNKYSAEYVNRLKNMVDRNISVPYEFVCFTENASGIDSSIRIEPLPQIATQGWWYKPYFLSGELPFKGTLLFLDLDVVVFRKIDDLFQHSPGKFCVIRDFNRSFRPQWDRMNSSVFRTEIGQYDNLWQDFKRDIKSHTTRNRGDQDWMFRHIKDHVFWPDEWIQSYKWEMRNKEKLQIVNGKRNFATIDDPKVLPNTKIAVFHGDPNPADCLDPWVVDNWK